MADWLMGVRLGKAGRRQQAVRYGAIGILAAGFCFGGVAEAQSRDEAAGFYRDIFDRVQTYFVEPVSSAQLVQTAIEGMLASIDPESGYIEPSRVSQQTPEIPGDVPELGLVVTLADSVVVVIATLDGGAAAKAGLRPRDRIVAIDNQPVSDQSLADAVSKLRGAPDSTVRIHMQRGPNRPNAMDLTRHAQIPAPVTARLDNGVAILRLPRIAADTAAQTKAALAGLKAQRKDPIHGMVVDLRSNPGGSVDGAVATANLFVRQGVIVTVKRRQDAKTSEIRADPTKVAAADLIGDMPVVVLIDGGTSGSAEILAGALQGNRRAVVVGTQSFGKGTVHSLIKLSDGGALRLATGRYVTPSGAQIEGKGIAPDIEVQPARLDLLAEGFTVSEARLRGALANPTLGKSPAAPAANTDSAPAAATAVPAKDDYQLARAVDLARGIALYAQVPATPN